MEKERTEIVILPVYIFFLQFLNIVKKEQYKL